MTRVAAAIVVTLIAPYAVALHPWLMDWGSTPEERSASLPGTR